MTPSPAVIELVRIDASNWRDALAVSVDADQLRFVADHQPVALVILAKSYVDDGGRKWRPFMISAEGTVVGVVAIATSEATCELLHLAIDRDRQRQGLGRAALEAAIDLVCREGVVDALELTAHPDNTVAQTLYERSGFVRTGEARHGEPVWRRPIER